MQTVDELKSALADHPFLSVVDNEHIDRIAQWAFRVEFQPKQYLCHARHRAERLYLTLSGRVALGLDDPSEGLETLQTLDAPGVVGISWLSPPYKSC